MQPASPQTAEILRTNWIRVVEQVAEACHAAGRRAEDVRIIGVSKYVGPDLTLQLAQAGCAILGENRPQVVWEKEEAFRQSGDATPKAWHLIGHLQRNKIRRTLPLIECLHSLDSLRLAEALHQEATKQGIQLSTLIEVNVTQDAAKTGLPPEILPELLDRAAELTGLRLEGLMAMSTQHADSHAIRREFASVRTLLETMASRFPDLNLRELSMGMSGDFREAIAEGATMVRIGSNLWEGILGT